MTRWLKFRFLRNPELLWFNNKYRPSCNSFICPHTCKPVKFVYNEKHLHSTISHGGICTQPSAIWKNRNQYNTSGFRKFSTYRYSRFLIQRREVLILIFAGISGGVLYGWSKKLENDRRDKEMEELDEMMKISQESHNSGGKPELTIKLYKEALQRVKTLIGSEVKSHQRMSILTTKFVFIIDQIANLLHNLGKLDEAEDYYKQTIQALISHGTEKDDHSVIEISLKLASIYAEQGRHELAENGFTWCVNNARKKVPDDGKCDINSLALLGICLESYGKYRISQRDANKAITLFTEALEISRKVFGSKHQQVAMLLNNLAVAYNEAGDTDMTKTLFQEAIVVGKESLSDDLWSFHFNLANILVLDGDLESAKIEYEKALEICHEDNVKSSIKDRISKLPMV
ncbi:tetratricopeptide repeat protein 19, mitochondrial-like isoform X1 [Dendronephthya gigantea]|uniref:tetratricopeptide repeat protein 19, mitochondrial-like isoform X1 n=1 Tax=Dendronephthya gigantea TaxID=151771 RepID=UPI00106CF6A7|nr:tetratricopeptide repeat protein 19, mitochondrial-like isoform X1 [Dendronephthya gigantea]